MSRHGTEAAAEFVLPPSTATKRDLAQLVRELEWVDGALSTVEARDKTGISAGDQPQMSSQLAEFVEVNSLTLDESGVRSDLITRLRHLKDDAPVVHMTFAGSADGESLGRIVEWLRAEIHPQTVLVAGVQPALVAGVAVRTPNHVYDLSLRKVFDGRRGELVSQLETLSGRN